MEAKTEQKTASDPSVRVQGDVIRRLTMQTVDAKARVICHKLGLPDDGTAFDIIRRAIKEQDRDTRHACAEAVINAADPHAACMNARAV